MCRHLSGGEETRGRTLFHGNANALARPRGQELSSKTRLCAPAHLYTSTIICTHAHRTCLSSSSSFQQPFQRAHRFVLTCYMYASRARFKSLGGLAHW